jgi:hypothetical protein
MHERTSSKVGQRAGDLANAEYAGSCGVCGKLQSMREAAEYAGSCGVCGKLRSVREVAEYAGSCGVCGKLRSMRKAADLANADFDKHRAKWAKLAKQAPYKRLVNNKKTQVQTYPTYPFNKKKHKSKKYTLRKQKKLSPKSTHL